MDSSILSSNLIVWYHYSSLASIESVLNLSFKIKKSTDNRRKNKKIDITNKLVVFVTKYYT